MVKTNMTTDGSESEHDSLAATLDRLRIQQRLIDIAARNLEASRESCRNLSSSGTSEEAQSTMEENIVLQENKMMKGFALQLILKHQHLKQRSSSDDETDVLCLAQDDAERELDQLINLKQFLNIVGLEPRTLNALLSDGHTLDFFFWLSLSELDEIMAKCNASGDDSKRLQTYLDFLKAYYEAWERGEKPTTSPYERLSSTSSMSRLSSVSTQGSLDHDARMDSVSSGMGSLASPFVAPPTPSPLTHSTPNVSNSSLLIPTAPPSGGHPMVGVCHSSAAIGGHGSVYPAGQSQILNRSYSSSTMLYPEVDSGHYSRSSFQSVPATKGPSRFHRKYSHKRSLSNPLANIILTSESGHSAGVSHGGRLGMRSPTPPHRCGSQPSMVSYSTCSTPPASATGPPSPLMVRTKGHPQVRRIRNLAPSNFQSFSADQLVPSPTFTPTPSTPDSPIFYHMSHASYLDHTPRCNSVSAEPQRSRSYQPKLNRDTTSSSMVDLPVKMAASSDHLDRINEYGLPHSGKSQSVPRLTFLSVSIDNDKVPSPAGSTSVPTSPRGPGMYSIAGRMGHSVEHRFTNRTFMTPHICDYCKKSLIFGVKCKDCRYKCHKQCSVKAPHSCGLPRELLDFYRKQVLQSLSSSSSEYVSPSEHNAFRPRMEKSSTFDADTRESQDAFIITDLTREPIKGQFSPVMAQKKVRHTSENGRTPHLYTHMSQPTLQVPPIHHHYSTSSSPSTSPPTSPSLTPSSPRSPNDTYQYPTYTYPTPHNIPSVTCTDESGDETESFSGEHVQLSDVTRVMSEDSLSSCGSRDGISDMERVRADTPSGLRPAPQVISAKSLPNLLQIPPSRLNSLEDGDDVTASVPENGYASDDNLLHQRLLRKDSLQRTLSTADSKTSTLVNSLPNDGDDDTDYEDMPPRPSHRNSVVDEWNIPYDAIRIQELVRRGPVGEVFKGYWHGEVSIKRFLWQDATAEQLSRFKEEVSILKKTRHENLALFMGASIIPPNLAIVTSFCKGHTLYKYIHVWMEPFSIDKSLNVSRQIAQAMGYLHARRIVHKDLNTKNIFLDKDKVVITDTGLSSLSDTLLLQQPGATGQTHEKRCGIVPRTKLYYLAPEIMRVLSACPEVRENGDVYPYTDMTDIYAFGTVLYELLARKFPFSTDSVGYPLETSVVIFLVGNGYRQEIQSKEVPDRLKDLVWACWHKDVEYRIPFSTIGESLQKLSRKKTPIVRSPSFPITLSRSHESLRAL